jgi:hypothetical protein
MALTALQRRICRLIAANRIASGESYVAGGVALNELLAGGRLSRDIDLFHDTDEAVATSWEADRRLLTEAGLTVTLLRERPSFIQAEATDTSGAVRMEWVRDSAYRFFPLVEHPDMGLALHPFDLATNKVLALISRAEPRDWIDAIHCSERLQPLGYLAWAACGKDPGFSPHAILEFAARTTHYADEEIAAIDFDGPQPSAADLSRRWKSLLPAAAAVVNALPPETSGTCVLSAEGDLFAADADAAREALHAGRLIFHGGRLRGALPHVRS